MHFLLLKNKRIYDIISSIIIKNINKKLEKVYGLQYIKIIKTWAIMFYIKNIKERRKLL